VVPLEHSSLHIGGNPDPPPHNANTLHLERRGKRVLVYSLFESFVSSLFFLNVYMTRLAVITCQCLANRSHIIENSFAMLTVNDWNCVESWRKLHKNNSCWTKNVLGVALWAPSLSFRDGSPRSGPWWFYLAMMSP
jgi:hypothetical protein